MLVKLPLHLLHPDLQPVSMNEAMAVVGRLAGARSPEELDAARDAAVELWERFRPVIEASRGEPIPAVRGKTSMEEHVAFLERHFAEGRPRFLLAACTLYRSDLVELVRRMGGKPLTYWNIHDLASNLWKLMSEQGEVPGPPREA